MAINFNNALGIHQHTIGIRAQRAEVLASNMANVDTPHYKARDLDFKTALAQANGSLNRQSLATTSEGHIGGQSHMSPEIKYRSVNQPDTGDGNTVDIQSERSNYLQNALEYQASVQFLASKFSGLNKAIKGGQ